MSNPPPKDAKYSELTLRHVYYNSKRIRCARVTKDLYDGTGLITSATVRYYVDGIATTRNQFEIAIKA